MRLTRNAISKTILALFEEPTVRQATTFLSERLIVRATARFKFAKRMRLNEIVLTVGQPNYREREFIRTCKKAKEPLPVKNVQLKFWPEKKRR